MAALSLSVTIRVTSSDDISGVAKILVSHQAGFASATEFTASSLVTDLPWQLQPSGQVYVKAVDRAGNVSTASSAQGPTSQVKLFLPLTIR